MTEQLIDVEALAEYLDVPAATVYRWNYLGTGPSLIKVGRHVRYRSSDVEAWLETRTTAAR